MKWILLYLFFLSLSKAGSTFTNTTNRYTILYKKTIDRTLEYKNIIQIVCYIIEIKNCLICSYLREIFWFFIFFVLLQLTRLIKYYIFRVSWLFSNENNNFILKILSSYQSKNNLKVVFDQIGQPLYTIELSKMPDYLKEIYKKYTNWLEI